MDPTHRYVAFLRGINLGRRRRVSSADLGIHFAELGFHPVQSFRASGNVVFAAAREPAAKLTERIEERLASSLRYDVAVFLRTAAEVRALAERRPFTARQMEASSGKLQVMLLSTKPSARARKQVLALATHEDSLEFGDRELYWLPSGGTRDSTLDLKSIDALLGPTTMRTKGTIDQLAAKYFSG